MEPIKRSHWQTYLIEAWALGTFMVVASAVVIVVQHPALPVRAALPSTWLRRGLIGVVMGLTAVGLIYSRWGKQSGAHLNPAVTLAQWQLNRISTPNALAYVAAQFVGGWLGVALMHGLFPAYMTHPDVNYAVTIPGPTGVWVALVLEFMMAFVLLTMVLTLSNSRQLAPYTGYFVGLVVALYITVEAPYSGMSINPARTVSSAVWANDWSGWWLYFLGPTAGMWLAGWLFRRRYRRLHGECRSMTMHLSGRPNGCATYQVLWWSEETPENQ
ncbi:MIP/aquaporin family protein [Fibrella aquatilis]|uniref:Aquaporin n=1 Tax=Fibrella aquatilis TaxID=2817059 RepID=A0A939K1J0_9BACT|nr:aquaporin [Fibrella aquatilis]MBO0932320.1 aquaporin [Fibrella aquatilis]